MGLKSWDACFQRPVVTSEGVGSGERVLEGNQLHTSRGLSGYGETLQLRHGFIRQIAERADGEFVEHNILLYSQQ